MRTIKSPWLGAMTAALTVVGSAFGETATNTPPVEMPEVTITGQPYQTELREDRLVGDNQQPEWTTQRRFATTRIYVLEPWQVEFEQWWKGKFPREGNSEHLFQSEVEVGLPYRFQLDVYENLFLSNTGNFFHQGNQVELRYALAEWGKIPLNPTLYGEWAFNNSGADAYELKLLLGEEFAPRWHWGLNLAFEQEVGGERVNEMALSQGISYTVLDEKLGAGVEMQVERTSAPNFNGEPEVEVLIGPSAQWRPIPRLHVDMVPLLGVTGDSPRVEAYGVCDRKVTLAMRRA